MAATSLVLVNAAASYWNVNSMAATHRRVVHTHEVRTLLRDALSLLTDAETGQRGFLLTGNEEYLEPYRDASVRVGEKLERLKELTADNAEQQMRFPSLEADIDRKLDELHRAVSARRDCGSEAALAIVRDGRGKQQMDTIRGRMAEMEATEQRALEERTAEADTRVGRTLVTIVVVSGLVLVYRVFRGLASVRRPAGSGNA